MTEDCKPIIHAQGRLIATITERLDGHRERLKEMHEEKVDRREFAPFKWLGATAGAGFILLIIGALGKMLLKQ